MILDLRELKKSGKTVQNYFFEYGAEDISLDIPDVKIEGAVRVCGSITLTGEHSAEVEGEAAFLLKGNCTRCLEETEKEITVSFFEECDEEEDNPYPVVLDRIDLKKIVDDTIIMNAPLNFLCSEDCKGICAGCGVNLNHGECKC